MRSKSRWLLLALLLVPFGCLDEGTKPPPIFWDASNPYDGGGPRPTTPIIDYSATPSSTCNLEVAIVGTAQANVTVFANGAAAAGSTRSLPGSGRFCLPVKLNAGQVNSIEVRSQDPVSGMSEPAIVTITHTSCGAQDSGVPASSDSGARSVNVAFRAQTTGQDTPVMNNYTFVTDGNLQNFVEVAGGGITSYKGWIKVSFETVQQIQRVVIHWRDNSTSTTKSYGKKYYVLSATLADASAPNLTDGHWTKEKEYTAGAGGIDEIVLERRPLIRHLALYLEEDGEWDYIGKERFAIAEIEAYNVPVNQPPPPPPQICSGY